MDSSTERDNQQETEHDDQYGTNTSNAVHEYSSLNKKNKQSSKAKQAVASLKAAFPQPESF